jgi:hypothetical protein
MKHSDDKSVEDTNQKSSIRNQEKNQRCENLIKEFKRTKNHSRPRFDFIVSAMNILAVEGAAISSHVANDVFAVAVSTNCNAGGLGSEKFLCDLICASLCFKANWAEVLRFLPFFLKDMRASTDPASPYARFAAAIEKLVETDFLPLLFLSDL